MKPWQAKTLAPSDIPTESIAHYVRRQDKLSQTDLSTLHQCALKSSFLLGVCVCVCLRVKIGAQHGFLLGFPVTGLVLTGPAKGHQMQQTVVSESGQVEERFINKVTASFIADSYEDFAKKEVQETIPDAGHAQPPGTNFSSGLCLASPSGSELTASRSPSSALLPFFFGGRVPLLK